MVPGFGHFRANTPVTKPLICLHGVVSGCRSLTVAAPQGRGYRGAGRVSKRFSASFRSLLSGECVRAPFQRTPLWAAPDALP
jgi:hypothetical protein